MRRIEHLSWHWLMLALVASPVLAHDQIPGTDPEAPILLRGGNLYTVADGVLEDADLLIKDGRIAAIGRDIEVQPEPEVIDVSGQRVYPGLIAPGTVLGLTEISAVRATRDRDEVGSINPEVAAHVAYNPDSELIPSVRSHGVTTVQVMPTGALLTGRTAILHLDGWTKEDAAVRLIDGLALSWPRVTVREAWYLPPVEKQRQQMETQRTEVRRAFDAARTYALARAAGHDVDTDLRWEAMRPLWDDAMPLYVAAEDYRQILEAVDFADDYDLNMVLVKPDDAWRLTDLLVERDIPVLLSTPTGRPPRSDADYDAAYRQATRLHEAGVRFGIGMLGDGTGVRNLAIEGAGAAIAWGLPEDMALRAITLSNAEILGIDDRQGSLEIGKDATLFVSTGDVTDTLGHEVTRMWIRGREVDLDNRHHQLARKYREKIRRTAAD